MPTKLTRLKLHELSLVDNPANKEAKITIFKRDEKMSETKKIETKEESFEELKKQMSETKERLNQVIAFGNLSEEEKDLCKNMSDEDLKKFLALSVAEKKAELQKSKDKDEVLLISGAQVKKSEVGNSVFGVLKAQQEQLAMQAEAIQKAKEAVENAQFMKRASKEFTHVVGTDAEKAALLKHVSKMPEEVKKTAEAILVACEKMTKNAFKNIGHRKDSGVKTSSDELDELAEQYANLHKVSFESAYASVINKHADLYEASLEE